VLGLGSRHPGLLGGIGGDKVGVPLFTVFFNFDFTFGDDAANYAREREAH
jgi:hypothetical protein